jgi:hypothetical protein
MAVGVFLAPAPAQASSALVRAYCVWLPGSGGFTTLVRGIAYSVRPTAWPVTRDGRRVGTVYSPRPGYWQQQVPAGWHTYRVATPGGTVVASLRLRGGACVPR